jgi:hypothetical protein
MPKMKAARQQYALELATLGIVKDPKKLMEMLELGQGEPDDEDKATAQADRENNMMLFGVWRAQTNLTPEGQDIADSARFDRLHAAIPVKSWHNHQIHIVRHTSVMMDEEFEELSISKPEVVQLFDQHIALHQQEIQKAAEAQMQMLQAQKGAPDGPPTPAGGDEAGQAAQTQNGATLTNRVQTGVPDVIGGGTVQATARQIRPQ